MVPAGPFSLSVLGSFVQVQTWGLAPALMRTLSELLNYNNGFPPCYNDRLETNGTIKATHLVIAVIHPAGENSLEAPRHSLLIHPEPA